MPNAPDIPLFAAAALAAASASFTAFGVRRQPAAGWLWWVAAMWLTTLGALLAALLPSPWGPALAAPLLLQWPLVALMGLRRFHARMAWPGHALLDTALLAAACLAASVGSLRTGDDAAWGATLVTASFMGVHLYAAAVLFMGPNKGGGAAPLQGLGAAIALAAFAPELAALGSTLGAVSPWARAVAATLGAVVLAFVTLTLVCERTERQLRDSRRRLRVLANLDALTHMPNRRHFAELATQALVQDAPGSAVLLIFDVDHFKQINDEFGHAAGDRALCIVSDSVVEHLRAPDVAGRHGGDEFVLLLRQATTPAAMGAAARIVAEVQRRAAVKQLPMLSLSFGLVQVRAGETIDTALRRADQALYEAKRQGRSRAVAAVGDEDEPVFSESRTLGLLPLLPLLPA